MQLLPGFGGGSRPPPVVAPPPTPAKTEEKIQKAQETVQQQEQSPEVTQAKDELRKSELARKGRAAAILTSGKGVQDRLGTGTTIARPRASALLGG